VTPSTSRLPRVATRLAILLAATFLAAACGSSGPTASPSPASAAPSSRSSQAASQSAVPSAAGNADLTQVPGGTTAPPVEPSGTPTQTDTAWGRIWDAVPVSFPRLEASIPADSISGPVSAAFVVGAGPADVTSTMKRLLDGEGYRTDQSGPLEDGSFVLDSTGPWEGCRVQTTVTPQSGTTLMTIFYGADCPFE
jgi:hypothetical protein